MAENNNKKKKFTSAPQNKIKSNKNKKARPLFISPSENPKYGYCEYVMSPECAADILATRNKIEQKEDPQKYLCDFVNEQYGLKMYCVNVKF